VTSGREAIEARSGSTSSGRTPWSLAIWVLGAAGLMLAAPRPPAPLPETPEETAAVVRSAELALEAAKTWQAEHGDLRIAWDDAEGHLAIVIDDVGRELYHFERLHALRVPVSFSVLPGSAYAPGVQLRLLEDDRRPREILLHLPMEPAEPEKMHEGLEAQEDFLLATDDTEALRRKVRDALARVPTAAIVNNHMGSALTRDRAAMDAVMAELKAQGRGFLDSRTIGDTVAQAAAQGAAIPAVAREVFLDHDPSAEAIEAALDRAAETSREHPVIAIGHPSAAMVEVLERRLPQLHAQGIGVFSVHSVIAHGGAATNAPGPDPARGGPHG
jgi:polysaccharide deacetylase 2 family uncharacterized protein YibQ